MEILAIIAVAGMLFVIVVNLAFYASRYRKVGPNQALVISGRQRLVRDAAGTRPVGYRVVTAGGTFLWPIVERVDALSLKAIPIPFDVAVHFRDGAQADLAGTASVAVDRNEEAIYRAATRLGDAAPAGVATLAGPMLAAEIRACAADTTAAELEADPRRFPAQVAQALDARLVDLGLTCLSVDLSPAGGS